MNSLRSHICDLADAEGGRQQPATFCQEGESSQLQPCVAVEVAQQKHLGEPGGGAGSGEGSWVPICVPRVGPQGGTTVRGDSG